MYSYRACPICEASYTVGPQLYQCTLFPCFGINISFFLVKLLNNFKRGVSDILSQDHAGWLRFVVAIMTLCISEGIQRGQNINHLLLTRGKQIKFLNFVRQFKIIYLLFCDISWIVWSCGMAIFKYDIKYQCSVITHYTHRPPRHHMNRIVIRGHNIYHPLLRWSAHVKMIITSDNTNHVLSFCRVDRFFFPYHIQITYVY